MSGARGKFKAKKVHRADGLVFDSKEEAKAFAALEARAARGEISALEAHPQIKIIIAPNCQCADRRLACIVEADARYVDSAGKARLIDFKGYSGDTKVSRLKRQLAACAGYEIELEGSLIKARAKAAGRKAWAKFAAKAVRTRGRARKQGIDQ